MGNEVSLRVKAQRFGGKLSTMILPNLGAFMGWGIITAIGIFSGNEMLKSFIVPVLTYLLPLLIAISGGRMVYGEKGAVIGAFATMGIIIGADITMLLGAMIIAPLSAWILKKVDKVIEPYIPVGFELLIGNLTVAILGALLAIIGCIGLAPALCSLSSIFAEGVSTLENMKLLPLTAIFIEPAKVLFLNNAIGQGILTPLGTTQLNDLGKSVLFLLESNPGPGVGVLLAYCVFGKGNAKANAYGATVIHFFGGIHEIYFPYILMKPSLIVATIAGGVAGTFVFTTLKVGLVGVSSPGSVITILMMSAAGDQLKILLGIVIAAVVSCLIASIILKSSKMDEKEINKELKEAAKQMEALKGKKSRISSVFENEEQEEENTVDYSTIKTILYVCDAGLGSSAMGASVVAKKLKKQGIMDIKVPHARVNDLPKEADIIITHRSLKDLVCEKQKDVSVIDIEDYLNAPEYEELVNNICKARGI